MTTNLSKFGVRELADVIYIGGATAGGPLSISLHSGMIDVTLPQPAGVKFTMKRSYADRWEASGHWKIISTRVVPQEAT